MTASTRPFAAAEASFMLADAYQGQGVTTLLFESLSEYGRARGILRFIAEVKAQDTALLEIFAATGLRCTRRGGTETVRVEIDLRPTAAYRASCDRREAIAEVASVAAVLRPRSIAVVGAGRRAENAGHQVVRSLLVGDFSGTVYPVNPAARAVCGVPAFPALLSIPEPVDLAVVAVPAAAVPGVIDEAASAGVRAVTIITAGFGETGRCGAAVETGLLSVARRHGMRIVGPNCLGVMNTDPAVRMNATFASLDPLPGHLALVSQSGAVGIVLSEQTRAAGLGLSAFVSVGNKLDVSPNDLLCFFEDDERTSVVALYLESLGNPRKFARIARRVGAAKPIVALKAGRTSAGARGARSHTAAAATPEVTVAALLRSAGVIKVDRLEELLDVSAILLGVAAARGAPGSAGRELRRPADPHRRRVRGRRADRPGARAGDAERAGRGAGRRGGDRQPGGPHRGRDRGDAGAGAGHRSGRQRGRRGHHRRRGDDGDLGRSGAPRHRPRRAAGGQAGRGLLRRGGRPVRARRCRPESPRSRHRSERRWLSAASAATRSGADAQCCPHGNPKSRPTIR